MNRRAALLLVVAALELGCKAEEPRQVDLSVRYTQQREPCAQRNVLRNLYFGDLHFHTRYSWDAAGYDLTVAPEDSYRFARGEAIGLPPLDRDGEPTRQVQLARPLDFAAATDHAEYLGETSLCTTPGSAVYSTEDCEKFRTQGEDAVTVWGMRLTGISGHGRPPKVCGEDGARCVDAAKQIWQRIKDAAESAYDKTPECRFVAFAGYEYTASPKVTNEHRNIIFRNGQALAQPISYYEQESPWGLRAELKRQCLDGDEGCDAMIIPHNTNWSNGVMFHPDFSDGEEIFGSRAEAAQARAELEPLVEIFQHKGDMECQNGLSGVQRHGDDPRCENEKLRFDPLPDCGEGTGLGGIKDNGCVSRFDFVRGILLQGLREQQDSGVNPYRCGVIGSTDSHNGTPGNTWEKGWMGHVGVADDTPEERMGEGNMTHRGRVNNPGGLAAVWALERSRDAIFEAMRRREVYGTSGTRIRLRLFGGWDYAADLCGGDDLPEQGYLRGVPMGGTLPSSEGFAAPAFVVQAEYDPGTTDQPGTLLQSAQIIKGWIDAEGQAHEQVFEVAGDAHNGAAVNAETCEQSGPGAEQLCAVWHDPDFDPTQRAFYYARVLENPSCRWSSWECNALSADSRPKGCADPNIKKQIQERAWSSAIWYEP